MLGPTCVKVSASFPCYRCPPWFYTVRFPGQIWGTQSWCTCTFFFFFFFTNQRLLVSLHMLVICACACLCMSVCVCVCVLAPRTHSNFPHSSQVAVSKTNVQAVQKVSRRWRLRRGVRTDPDRDSPYNKTTPTSAVGKKEAWSRKSSRKDPERSVRQCPPCSARLPPSLPRSVQVWPRESDRYWPGLNGWGR